MAINTTRQSAATAYMVIGDKGTGKTQYIAEQLAKVAQPNEVLWVSTFAPAPVDFHNVTIVTETDVTELLKDPAFPSYKHVVLDNASIFSDILLANIDEKSLMQVYGVLGQRMVLYVQRFMKHRAALHCILNTRITVDTKVNEIAMSDKALGILYAVTNKQVFASHGRDAKTGATIFRFQEDSVKAMKLQA